MNIEKLADVFKGLNNKIEKARSTNGVDLNDEAVYNTHLQILYKCCELAMAKEFKPWIIDNANRELMNFLFFYFNNSPRHVEYYVGKGFQLHKSLLICGSVGVGKTKVMEVFSEYCRLTENPRFFHNMSVTQMVNYQKINSHLDKYTYNEINNDLGFAKPSFAGKPFSLCLNDVGLETYKHFGQDTHSFIAEFFHARNEIWTQQGKFCHITTNLSPKELMESFKDEHGRLTDRWKTYNIIALDGESRR